ncbi:RNA polymerase sigma-70 factor (family 1) [Pedobacter sp. CG_S7]|uniref:RNA polymerase sigma factor n=1 Tax=Pedobacter sp. CG_S7 TaxID=3143930 RepID=UPI003395AA83
MSAYKLYTDNELVLLLRKGDHAAFTEIYIRYSGALYNNAYKLLKNRNEVKDIVQEIFASLWNRRSDFIINTNLAGYLYIAARYKVIKIISHQQITSKYFNLLQTSINEGFMVTDHSIREKQLAEIIEKEINELPSKMRQVFNLSRKSYLTHKEIAKTLDLSECTVKKQVNNALKILRIKLEIFHYLFIISFPIFLL